MEQIVGRKTEITRHCILDASDGKATSKYLVWFSFRAYLHATYSPNQKEVGHRADIYGVLFMA